MKNNPFEKKIEPLENRDVKDWKDLEKSFDVLHSGKNKWQLSKKQKLIAYALSLGWDYKQASTLTGIQAKTIEKWLKEEPFKAFMKACDHVSGIDQVNSFLADRLAVVVKSIDDLATSESTPEAVRLQAAKMIFQQVLGGVTQKHEHVTIRDIYQKMDAQDEDEGIEEFDNSSNH